ncbi:MAG: acyl-CoA thioesterase [Myxococcales bacterium]|nr:acyl-CoA thioesterase [Myxococcales bacterium]
MTQPIASRDMTARSPDHSQVTMTELVLPQHTNALGTAFGGQVLSWVDIAAGICAGRHARAVCVTASFDEVHFKLPIHHGDVINISGVVTWTGRTSMEVRVRVDREQIDGRRQRALEAFATFVCVDTDGRPQPIPPLELLTDEHRACHSQAEQRRARRLQNRAR